MTSRIASVKINQRLEKLDSNDYDNITKERKEEVLNKVAVEFIRERVKNVDEVTQFAVEDLQLFLKPVVLSSVDKGLFNETGKLPKDYLFFKRLTPECAKGSCDNVTVVSTPVEESNVDVYLSDFGTQPSFDFEETFHTMVSNRFRIYHNKDFSISEVGLIYYRKPIKISFASTDLDKEWEWKEDQAELIIDKAVMILAGDTENATAVQTSSQRVQNNN